MNPGRHSLATREVDQSPDGSHVGALFDLDKTLLRGFSGNTFYQRRLQTGDLSVRELLSNALAYANYARGNGGFPEMIAKTSAALKGIPEARFIDIGEDAFRKHLVGELYPEARALVRAHQDKGHTVAIVSSALPYQIDPIARYLEIDEVRCTRLEVEDGVFTGNAIEPVCWGEGKAIAGRELAREFGLDLDQTFFYSDSHEDLPLLELVGKPRPLNADEKLAAIARNRNWPMQTFMSRAKPGVNDLARTVIAFASIPVALLAGLPARWLSGSSRRQADLTSLVWNGLAGAAVKLDVRVQGRERVWSHRPAVFVYNHQSDADVLIIGELLQRNFSMVASKDVESKLIAGTFLKGLGTVFVDRDLQHTVKDPFHPAVDLLRDGVSIAISAEHTRSHPDELGQMDPGVFRMAMSASVPIVPIAIHNAVDALPPGASVFRPAAIEVDVLPPVPTDEWDVEQIDDSVSRVREMFREALGY